MKNKTKAFTIIEILLVTGILSLLMSVVFFRVTEAKKKAEDIHMVAESAQVSKAVFMYKESSGNKVPGHTLVNGNGEPRTLLERNPGESTINPEYVQAFEPLVTSGLYPEIPESPSGEDYAYVIGPTGDEAVFAADLHFPRKSKSNNSCPMIPIVEPEIDYGTCAPIVVIYDAVRENGQIVGYAARTCAPGTWNPQTEVCILNPPSYSEWAICELESQNGICNGSSDSDYCECL